MNKEKEHVIVILHLHAEDVLHLVPGGGSQDGFHLCYVELQLISIVQLFVVF